MHHWRTWNRSVTLANRRVPSKRAPSPLRRATDTEPRRRQPPPQRIEPTNKKNTCNQNKNKSNLTHACLKNTRNDLPSDLQRETAVLHRRRDPREIITDLLPRQRPTERDDSETSTKRETFVVSSTTHEEIDFRRFVYDPRRETIPRRRRAMERRIIAVWSRNRRDTENRLFADER